MDARAEVASLLDETAAQRDREGIRQVLDEAMLQIKRFLIGSPTVYTVLDATHTLMALENAKAHLRLRDLETVSGLPLADSDDLSPRIARLERSVAERSKDIS